MVTICWSCGTQRWEGIGPCGMCGAPASRDHLLEQGRRLASQREDLIAAGVDPADLLIPLAPLDTDNEA